jgi:hypothetical protein
MLRDGDTEGIGYFAARIEDAVAVTAPFAPAKVGE